MTYYCKSYSYIFKQGSSDLTGKGSFLSKRNVLNPEIN